MRSLKTKNLSNDNLYSFKVRNSKDHEIFEKICFSVIWCENTKLVASERRSSNIAPKLD